DAVAGVDDRVQGGIDADRLPGEADVVVDRGGDPDHRHAVLESEMVSTLHRAVAADDDQALEGVLLEGVGRLGATLPGEEPGRASGTEHGPSQASGVFDVR